MDAVLGLSSPPLTYRQFDTELVIRESCGCHGPATARPRPDRTLPSSEGVAVTATVDLYVSLHEADVCVVLDLTAGRLPAVVHWGA